MNTQNFVRMYNQPKQLSDLIKMNETIYETLPISAEMSYEEWIIGLTKLGYDVEKIHFHPSSILASFFYVDEYTTGTLFDLSLSTLGDSFFVNVLEMNDVHKKMLIEDKNYYMYFFPEGNPFVTDYFKKYYHLIPKEEIVNVFVEMYTVLETGFEYFSNELIQEIFSLASQEEIDKLLTETYGTVTDTYTIYRGEHEDSNSIENSLSWTLSQEVAEFFASRINGAKGNIYTATVKKEDILYYINLRDEEEVLVNYKDLTNIELLATK